MNRTIQTLETIRVRLRYAASMKSVTPEVVPEVICREIEMGYAGASRDRVVTRYDENEAVVGKRFSGDNKVDNALAWARGAAERMNEGRSAPRPIRIEHAYGLYSSYEEGHQAHDMLDAARRTEAEGC